jgi:hypothetical protein
MGSAADATPSKSRLSSSTQEGALSREQYDALRAYFPSGSSVAASEGEEDAELKSILQQLRADPVTWLSVYIDRLPEHLLRHVFAYATGPRLEGMSKSDTSPALSEAASAGVSRPSPAQRGTIKRVAQRRRRFFETISSAEGHPISLAQGEVSKTQARPEGKQLDALEEELSLRSMRAKEPLLYQQLVGNLKLPARSTSQKKNGSTDETATLEAEDEGLPPPLASAQPASAPEGFGASPGRRQEELRPNQMKGAAFTRYLQKIDDEDAQIELERKMQTDEETEDDEEDEDAGRADGTAQDGGLRAFQEALMINFIRGDGVSIIHALLSNPSASVDRLSTLSPSRMLYTTA